MKYGLGWSSHGEKWVDLKCILYVEPARFAETVAAGYETKRGIKVSLTFLS